MHETLELIGEHGQSVIFALVFLDQLGVPLPTGPLLFALGALAGSDRLEPFSALVVAMVASVCADYVWYRLGRWKGTTILGWLCRAAIEPDSCVSRTHDLFTRYGVKSLLVAKLVPGFDTVAPPIAGLTGVRPLPFLLWSGAGALVWLLAFGGLGFAFSDQLEGLAGTADRFGGTVLLALAGLTLVYVAWKIFQRQRLLRSLRTERITPAELHELMLAGGEPFIVDVRSDAGVELQPFLIQGARRLRFEELDTWQSEVPRDRDVIVYCT
jgi:membrane protein DedA with SNARE-associated domain